jgi:DNA-binding IclR family transcriptional regulator
MRRADSGTGQGRRGAERAPPLVRSVERATRIMTSLMLAGHDGKRICELSEELDLHKTTVTRLLHTLIATRVARKEEEGDRYHWDALTWFSLASNVIAWAAETIEGELRRLAEASGATAGLAVPDAAGRNMNLTAYALPTCPLKMDPRRTRSLPMQATALGKAYLSGLPEAELEDWLKGDLARVTEHTLTSRREVRREIARCRKQGYAVSRGEGMAGTCAVGVPVWDPQGRVTGALGLAAPAEQTTEEGMRGWVLLLTEASRKLSQIVYASSMEHAS